MAEEYATPDEEQAAFDTEFTYIMECERSLDDVVEKLASIGLRVKPGQRHLVARWLDMFSQNSPIPLSERLAMLRGLLRSGRSAHG